MSDQGKYRKTYVRLWRHPGFAALSDAEKTFALYLLTGPQTNRLGCYMLSLATAAEDLGTVPETLKKRLGRVCQTFGWLFDSKARVFYVPSWFKFNPPDNVNVMKGIMRDLNEIPPCGLVDAFAHNIGTLPDPLHPTFLEGLRQRLPKGMPTQEQYQEQKQKQKQEQETALRAGALNGKSNGNNEPRDERLEKIARLVLKEMPKVDLEGLVDAFLWHCRNNDLQANRDAALRAFKATGMVS